MKPVGESLPAVFLIGALSVKIQISILITVQETIMTAFGITAKVLIYRWFYTKWLKMVKSSRGRTRGMLGVSVLHITSSWAEVSTQCNKHVSATVISNSDAKSVVVEVAPLTGGNRHQCEPNTRCLHTAH